MWHLQSFLQKIQLYFKKQIKSRLKTAHSKHLRNFILNTGIRTKQFNSSIVHIYNVSERQFQSENVDQLALCAVGFYFTSAAFALFIPELCIF